MKVSFLNTLYKVSVPSINPPYELVQDHVNNNCDLVLMEGRKVGRRDRWGEEGKGGMEDISGIEKGRNRDRISEGEVPGPSPQSCAESAGICSL